MNNLKVFERIVQFVFLLVATSGVYHYIGDEAAELFLLALITINIISIKLHFYESIGRRVQK